MWKFMRASHEAAYSCCCAEVEIYAGANDADSAEDVQSPLLETSYGANWMDDALARPQEAETQEFAAHACGPEC